MTADVKVKTDDWCPRGWLPADGRPVPEGTALAKLFHARQLPLVTPDIQQFYEPPIMAMIRVDAGDWRNFVGEIRQIFSPTSTTPPNQEKRK